MKVVVLVPRRGDGGRRDELWDFTRAWLEANHPDYEIVTGDSPAGPFNRGAAINAAARAAGDWDIAIVHDGDNIVPPEQLREAVKRAHYTKVMHYAHDAYYYLDRRSSDRIMAGPDHWWVVPQIYNGKVGYREHLLHKHISGVQAVPRSVWDATGGFVELTGWGSEDSIFAVLANTLGGGVEWVYGPCYHLFHDHAAADVERGLVAENRKQLMNIKRLEKTYPRHPESLKEELRSMGHPVP